VFSRESNIPINLEDLIRDKSKMKVTTKFLSAALFVSILLVTHTAVMFVVKADSQDYIMFSSGVAVYCPLNRTYTTRSLTLSLSYGVGLGIGCSITYDIDSKYQGKVSLSAKNPTELHVVNPVSGTAQLPELTDGSHRLTINVVCSFVSSPGAKVRAPFKPSYPGSSEYIATWTNEVYFVINTGSPAPDPTPAATPTSPTNSLEKTITYEKITISGDGTVVGTDKIQRNGNVYTLKDNFYNSTIIVLRDNIVLDGSGFTLKGSTGWVSGLGAINLTCSNVTVQNFNIVGFFEAGVVGAYNGNNILSNNITGTDRAIAVYADDYHIEGNYLADNHIGIRIVGKNNNSTQNHIADNYVGFSITNSSNNNIIANIIEKNMEAISTDTGGFQVYHNNFINQTIGSGGSWEATILSTDYFSSGLNVTLKPEWDNGYPSGGNYWSDYATIYPNATEIAGSGIGDTAYFIGLSAAINSTHVNTYIVEAVDRYPLTKPFNISEPVIPISTPTPTPSPEPTPKIELFPATLVFVASVGIALSDKGLQN